MQNFRGQVKSIMVFLKVAYYDIFESGLYSNVDYPDSLGSHEIVRIIEGPDNRKYEY